MRRTISWKDEEDERVERLANERNMSVSEFLRALVEAEWISARVMPKGMEDLSPGLREAMLKKQSSKEESTGKGSSHTPHNK